MRSCSTSLCAMRSATDAASRPPMKSPSLRKAASSLRSAPSTRRAPFATASASHGLSKKVVWKTLYMTAVVHSRVFPWCQDRYWFSLARRCCAAASVPSSYQSDHCSRSQR